LPKITSIYGNSASTIWQLNNFWEIILVVANWRYRYEIFCHLIYTNRIGILYPTEGATTAGCYVFLLDHTRAFSALEGWKLELIDQFSRCFSKNNEFLKKFDIKARAIHCDNYISFEMSPFLIFLLNLNGTLVRIQSQIANNHNRK